MPWGPCEPRAEFMTVAPNRLRDAFVVSLLQGGVLMDRGQAPLGHSSIKVTEKHYSPWVRATVEGGC